MSSLSSLQAGPETLSLWGSVAAVQRWLRLRTSSKLVVIAGILYALFMLWLPFQALTYGYVLVIYLVATIIWQRTHPEQPSQD